MWSVGAGFDSNYNDASVRALFQRDEADAQSGYWRINKCVNFVLQPSLQTIFYRKINSLIRFNELIWLWVDATDDQISAGIICKGGYVG